VVIPRAFFHIAKTWGRCRAGMGGYAVLPGPGGVNDQPAWLMEAFGVLGAFDAEMGERKAPDGRDDG
jgi:hypothetical protein